MLNSTLGNETCGKKSCLVYLFIVSTATFILIITDETFEIINGPLNYNSKKVVYPSE